MPRVWHSLQRMKVVRCPVAQVFTSFLRFFRKGSRYHYRPNVIEQPSKSSFNEVVPSSIRNPYPSIGEN